MKKTLQITIRQFLIKLNIYLIHNTYNSTPSKANAHKMVCTMTALLTATKNLEAQMSTKKQKDTQIVVHTFNGTQLSHKKPIN